MNASALKQRHISDLHERAAELGVERYRLLSRDELVDAILDKDPEGGGPAKPKPRRRSQNEGQRGREPRRGGERGSGGDRPRGGGGDRSRGGDRPAKAEVPEGPVEGTLEISGRGHGFIRISGESPIDGDVYVSASQIRRCDLGDGDVVAGPARAPRRGERHFALVHIDTVNGEAPGEAGAKFSDLTAVPPSRPVPLDAGAAPESDRGLVEAVGEKGPILFGQRVLVRAKPGAPRTPFVRAMAAALGAGEGYETTVVLIDEVPEEISGWKAVEGVDLVLAPADLRSREQARIAERAVAKAQRAVESGSDVVLVIDSLSRLAVASGDAGFVKPIFGAGRETEEEDAGSLTVIATTIEGDGADGEVDRALATTENLLIVLDDLLGD